MSIWAKKIFLIVSLGLIFISSAQAAIVSYNFTADRIFVIGTPTSGSLAETAASFATISGTISYDTATPNVGVFGFGSYSTGSLLFDQFGLPGGGSYSTTTANNLFGYDGLSLTYGLSSERLTVNASFIDSTRTLLSSAALPLFLSLTDPFASIIISQGRRRDRSTVSFNLTSLSAVPLPGALPMLLGTLAGATFLRRRRKQP